VRAAAGWSTLIGISDRQGVVLYGEGGNGRLRITVELAPDVARQLHGAGPATPATDDLARVVNDAGVRLEPIHPGVQDRTLRSFFTIDVRDDDAQALIERLLKLPAVTAAYLKPVDAMP
jgi:hypothetical protein